MDRHFECLLFEVPNRGYMSRISGGRVAVIGGGISGIGAAKVLQRNGYDVIIYEKTGKIGGIWSSAYVDARLQSSWHLYEFSDFPHDPKSAPDRHPTKEQICHYLEAAVEHFQLTVLLSSEVVAMSETEEGWNLSIKQKGSKGEIVTKEEHFCFVVISTGVFSTSRKRRLSVPGTDTFKGRMINEYQVSTAGVDFANKSVVILGNGKTSLDMVTAAAAVAKEAHHVFREPRWHLPNSIFGVVDTFSLLFSRASTALMPSWAYPTTAERFANTCKPFSFLIPAFWYFLGVLISLTHWFNFRHGLKEKGNAPRPPPAETAQRYKVTVPDVSLALSLRSATDMVPDKYFSLIAKGNIIPHRANVVSFTRDALVLSTGEEIPCDVVVASIGCEYPSFPFLKAEYRQCLEQEGGCQLYRHLIHPRIPNVGFAGFNHSFLHTTCCELGTLWLIAVMRRELLLPPIEVGETIFMQSYLRVS